MTNTCFLCRTQINSLFYANFNVDLNFTKCTNTLIRDYLTETFKNKVLIPHNTVVCSICKNLIDDLDYAENSYKEIRNTVWNYLGYKDNEKCSVYCQTENSETIKYKSFQCEQCLQNFDSDLAFQVHIKTHYEVIKEEDSVRCFNNEREFNVDVKQEEVVQDNIQTQGDGNEEETVINVGRGRKRKHPDVLKPYQCTICPKTWKTLGELKSHQVSHSDVRPFICEICGQSYKHKTALTVHVGMHNGIYPFICMYCKKTFTQKGALQRHLPIHTGDTPYQCDMCGKRFVHRTSFSIHKLSHSGQKDYKCSQCGLALLSTSHLKRHMRVHTGEKKYVCNLCDKRFAEKYNLVSHQKLHGKPLDGSYKRKHRCLLCTETFSRRLKLDEHMVQEHQKIV